MRYFLVVYNALLSFVSVKATFDLIAEDKAGPAVLGTVICVVAALTAYHIWSDKE